MKVRDLVVTESLDSAVPFSFHINGDNVVVSKYTVGSTDFIVELIPSSEDERWIEVVFGRKRGMLRGYTFAPTGRGDIEVAFRAIATLFSVVRQFDIAAEKGAGALFGIDGYFMDIYWLTSDHAHHKDSMVKLIKRMVKRANGTIKTPLKHLVREMGSVNDPEFGLMKQTRVLVYKQDVDPRTAP